MYCAVVWNGGCTGLLDTSGDAGLCEYAAQNKDVKQIELQFTRIGDAALIHAVVFIA